MLNSYFRGTSFGGFQPEQHQLSGMETTRAMTDMSAALSQAVSEKSRLMNENSLLKEKVASYEEKLSQVDKMFSTMMARISALEGNPPEREAARSRMANPGSIRRLASVSDESPRSPISERSGKSITPRTGLSSRSVSASRSRAGSQEIRGSLLKQPQRSVVAASRGRMWTSSGRSRSPSSVSRVSTPGGVKHISSVSSKSTSSSSVGNNSRSGGGRLIGASSKPVVPAAPGPGRPASAPLIRYEAQMMLHDKLIARAQIMPNLIADGPFLYVAQCELKPHVRISTSEMSGFQGLGVSVMGTNTRTRRTNVVFKSHSSHIDNPPVNEQDGYFAHSCWLSGPNASIISTVRVFYRMENDVLGESESPMVCLYGISLKYWFPESTDHPGESAPNFTKEHWKQLLKLLTLL